MEMNSRRVSYPSSVNNKSLQISVLLFKIKSDEASVKNSKLTIPKLYIFCFINETPSSLTFGGT